MEENDWCIVDYLKFIVVYALCLVTAFLMLKGVLLTNIFESCEKPTDIIMAIFAAITLICTFTEYRYHRKREKANVLGQYNERYSKDEHVNKVVDYIIRYMDNNVVNQLPSVHDVEMFLRFFEEMEIQIKENRMDENHVHTLFSYYAIKMADNINIRNNLGLIDYDNSNNWNEFKSFVDRMKKIGNHVEGSPVDKKDSIPIEKYFNKVIDNPAMWEYYEFESPIKSYIDIYNKAEELIEKFLFVSNKIKSDILTNCLNILKEKERDTTDLELNGRLRHIVSLFFWGHVLYQNVPAIKANMNLQFKQFVKSGLFENETDSEENMQILFSFMWFLLCIFHDFGYAYEKNLFSEVKDSAFDEDIDAELDRPDDFQPDIYSIENIEKYARYRKCAFGCKDHGIFGGKVFYGTMLEIGKLIAVDSIASKHFKAENVHKIYQYAAWVISCHNIFYNKGNNRFTNCYICQGLECFINPKARCLTLTRNPLLFLFCFADSIEPTKTLRSKSYDKKTDYEISKALNLSFENNTLKFDLSNIKCKEVKDKYLRNILSLNDWLIDVSDDLIIKFE